MSASDLGSLPQGDLRLIEHPVAQQLLTSDLPVRFAYTAMDGTPRVIPTWFHWTGEEVVMPTFISAPHISGPARRLPALRANPSIALTIDTAETPPDVLLMRGCVEITEVDGIVPEYAASARQYMGEKPAAEYLAMADQPGTRQARISLRPHWVGLLDFETRLPGG